MDQAGHSVLITDTCPKP